MQVSTSWLAQLWEEEPASTGMARYTAIFVILLHECHHITNLLRQSAEAVANATHLEVLWAEFMPHLLSWSSVKTELQVQERELCHTCACQEGVG